MTIDTQHRDDRVGDERVRDERVLVEPAPRVRPASDTWRDADRPFVAVSRDAVRWGPIAAGLITTLTTFLLLTLLALAIGLTAVDQPSSGDQASTVATGGAIVGAIIGLVSFFVGGFVAARTAAIIGRPAGALNGFLTWALGVVVILVLGALGLSGLLGAAGSIIGQVDPSSIQAPDVDPAQAADGVRDSALVAFVSLAIPALAAALGGALGARHEQDQLIEG